MLQREQGATLAKIMQTMGWQKHTVRGFMAGPMKKAGYTVESFNPEGGESSYRINLQPSPSINARPAPAAAGSLRLGRICGRGANMASRANRRQRAPLWRNVGHLGQWSVP